MVLDLFLGTALYMRQIQDLTISHLRSKILFSILTTSKRVLNYQALESSLQISDDHLMLGGSPALSFSLI